MADTEIRIHIDGNGNIHREAVEVAPAETGKPKLLKRVAASLLPHRTALDNR